MRFCNLYEITIVGTFRKEYPYRAYKFIIRMIHLVFTIFKFLHTFSINALFFRYPLVICQIKSRPDDYTVRVSMDLHGVRDPWPHGICTGTAGLPT